MRLHVVVGCSVLLSGVLLYSQREDLASGKLNIRNATTTQVCFELAGSLEGRWRPICLEARTDQTYSHSDSRYLRIATEGDDTCTPTPYKLTAGGRFQIVFRTKCFEVEELTRVE